VQVNSVISVYCVESNEVLKLKFIKLHEKVVSSVNPASIIDCLYQEHVISIGDRVKLQHIKDDPQRQCYELLVLLHTSEHPKAFVRLYLAIKSEPSLQRLVEDIDKFIDQPGMFYSCKM